MIHRGYIRPIVRILMARIAGSFGATFVCQEDPLLLFAAWFELPPAPLLERARIAGALRRAVEDTGVRWGAFR